VSVYKTSEFQPTNQPTIYFPQLKQIQSEHCKQQRKATREAIRLNELVAYVKKKRKSN